MSETILCIDDCEDIQELVHDYLEMEGYRTLAATERETALKHLKNENPDLVLLDLLMQDTDGLQLIKEIHANYPDMPVIMISGRGEDIDRIIGIEAGADDYIAKPFQPRELSARIKAVLKRSKKSEAPALNTQNQKIGFDRWVLDRNQFQVYDKNTNESANLTTGEFAVLERLILSKNQALSREQLFKLLRDHTMDVYDRAIDIQITRIRSKLGDTPKSPKYIKTIRNIGYIFVCDTQEIE